MDIIRIRGGRKLEGKIRIGGAKNAALPLMAASLLTSETLNLSNIPDLADITTMLQLLKELGVQESSGINTSNADGDKTLLTLEALEPEKKVAPYDLVRRMRASILVLGPLLARWGKARVSLPGGCAIGTRPVDLHLKGFEMMGAEIELKEGYIKAQAPNGLIGANVVFPTVSVGATENILMAATLADGKTTISNAAREPEIADLANCLKAMGAKIEGIGSDTLLIEGTNKLHSANHSVLPDRIETATYAVAAAITGGDIELIGTRADLVKSILDVLVKTGSEVIESDKGVRVKNILGKIKGIDIMTEPYPGFPTDMQAQIMALLAISNGASMITETIFENRFMHVPELCRMGADINVHGSSAIVRGVNKLSGAELMATDLRASVCLVLAALAAEGVTTLNRVYHLDRGYERLEEKLSECGADIKRIKS
jgi:UDP-N-acetylglucosamine 1-carboxyvinyltransferase